MKLYRKKNLFIIFLFIIICIPPILSSQRLGYIEKMTSSQWKAEYFLFSGRSHCKLHLNTPSNRLYTKIQTDGGSISLEIRDAAQKTIFQKTNIPTSTFAIKLSGDVYIYLKAEQHKGSFYFQLE